MKIDFEADSDSGIEVNTRKCSSEIEMDVREGAKKNWKKAVRLTAWVDPPLPSPEAVRKM